MPEPLPRINLSPEAREAQDELAAEAAHLTACREVDLEGRRAAVARLTATTGLMNVATLAIVVATLLAVVSVVAVLFL